MKKVIGFLKSSLMYIIIIPIMKWASSGLSNNNDNENNYDYDPLN